MIKNILELLSLDNYYGISEEIEIAKGKHELTTDLKKFYKQEIRKARWKKRR